MNSNSHNNYEPIAIVMTIMITIVVVMFKNQMAIIRIICSPPKLKGSTRYNQHGMNFWGPGSHGLDETPQSAASLPKTGNSMHFGRDA